MDRKIGVVGLGYVGLPVAVAFGQRHHIVGFDINEHRINTLKNNEDYTNEVDVDELKSADIDFTMDPSRLRDCDFIIVAVPTPININKLPDFGPLEGASKTVGANLTKGTIVVYESTVYPGATEEVCLPILEQESGLKAGEDFFIGYSPERINPGDKEHTFRNITKVVSGQTPEVLEIVAEVYESVVEAGVFKASSLKVAEAAKIIENTQRDLNIALMNELAIMFDRMDIDTAEVLEAAGTKWNFLKFNPGLVGGHCIGVDPYYLTHKSERVGYRPELILAGRRINDNMGKYIATALVKEMIQQKSPVFGSTVTVLGLTFKENVPDLRNSKVIDVIRELEEYGITVQVSDPYASVEEAKEEYGVDLTNYEELKPADAVVMAVPHKFYLDKEWDEYNKLFSSDKGIIVDIKAKLNKDTCPPNINLWRL
ncbi:MULTISPECIES: nucleotide sugar dehydrogenase [Sutcliffiella]|uniref:GDP-mannose dehydrogenase n=1 Tax=Sutcliffiella cohnii TaxID=33932 RepID=A0A223KV73_9BACI|nr:MULTISPECIES: nucleotide sugar dehydrogenase [Sutcliffiella]AST93382.1 GDP-mannose dehydrogenase [Sutcliffiella cohnii]WBL14548.1 nucleotide sugar dehydrogenase [Sutcliffiella sp. NC1]